MLDVGLIGLGIDWETRYRFALTALQSRLRIRAVHLPVASRAESVAAEFQCDIALSLSALIDRSDLRGFLILETGWLGDVPFLLTSRKGKAVFLGRGVVPDVLHRLPQLLDQSAPVMPELPLRYTPVTQRLRELIATSLGRIRRLDLWGGPEGLVNLIDWCRALLGQSTWKIAMPIAGCIEIQARRKETGEVIPISIHQTAACADAPEPLRGIVGCERGVAEFTGPQNLAWILRPSGCLPGTLPLAGDSGGQEVRASHPGDARQGRSECLTSDRDSLELMLDHFSRRVAGALVQVPSLDDLWIAHRLSRWADTHPQGSTAELSEEGVLG